MTAEEVTEPLGLADRQEAARADLAGGQGAGGHASGTPGKPSEGTLLKLAGRLPAGVLVELGCGVAVDSATACPQEQAERTAVPPAPSAGDTSRGASPRRRAPHRSCPSIAARAETGGVQLRG